jgi:hypothetical protein
MLLLKSSNTLDLLGPTPPLLELWFGLAIGSKENFQGFML